MDWKHLVTQRFAINVARVRGLLVSFKKLTKRRSTPDEPPSDPIDILRAAVVLLHATLEDLLRSLEELLLRNPTRADLHGIPFPGAGDRARGDAKITLVDLHTRFRGMPVDKVIQKAVDAHLNHLTYNNVADIKEAITRLRLPRDTFPPRLEQPLAVMIERRHMVAHRADVASSNPYNFRYLEGLGALTLSEVDSWTRAVEQLGNQVLAAFQEPTS